MAAAAAYHAEEEQGWKCPKHPSKRRRNGICATCLRDRLLNLCPDCANVRPCPCLSTSTTSSSSSSSSSSSFRRSRSVAIPFLRSNTVRAKTPSSLSVLWRNKTKGCESINLNGDDENFETNNRIEDFARMITRSRSVSAAETAMALGLRRANVSSSPAKRKSWLFSSPMKLFRNSRTVQDRSPLSRG
ncbi:hypothetical protein CDL12_01678 [Handroanthus impetiginosus]|uniref:Uncharacterized protein n=1 Tax=Handroanthus impetiginosus TaxID=429701 RepID=A0A2G9I751_9LAMI|nr:hypothetical protein CDL12_01678 [Handroanthus impetiginosus]